MNSAIGKLEIRHLFTAYVAAILVWSLWQAFHQSYFTAMLGLLVFFIVLVVLRFLPRQELHPANNFILFFTPVLYLFALTILPFPKDMVPSFNHVPWDLLVPLLVFISSQFIIEGKKSGQLLGLGLKLSFSIYIFIRILFELPIHLHWLLIALISILFVGIHLTIFRFKSGHGFLSTFSKKDYSSLISGTEQYLFFLGIGLFLILLLLKNAWVCDDAYITFRTVDNFIHGSGLTWNPVERVQTFTHPLWMFLISFGYFFTHDVYYTSIFMSLVFTVLTLVVLLPKIASNRHAVLAGVLILSFSKAFMDYSTSGLENSLSYFLLALFCFIFYKDDSNPKSFFQLALVASLAAVNRMDTMLIYLTPLLYSGWQTYRQYGRQALLKGLAGFVPLAAWELFSIWYYGFPFPNTAYAKLNTHMPFMKLLSQGVLYLLNSIRLDPVTMPAILVGLSLPLAVKKKIHYPLIIGVLLYLLYILKIGGDFMSGRHLAVPLLGAVILLTRVLKNTTQTSLLILAFIALLAMVSPNNPWKSDRNYHLSMQPGENIDDFGIADERGYYYPASGLLRTTAKQIFNPPASHPINQWLEDASNYKNYPKNKALIFGALGLFGFYAGPNVYIIDQFALSDPLLARLPILSPQMRIGHFERIIPQGYFATRENGKNLIENKDLAVFFDKLQSIIQGPLFSFTRLTDILKMNLGFYNHLIDISAFQEKPGNPRQERLLLPAQGNDEYAQLINQGRRFATNENDWEQARFLWTEAFTLNSARPEAAANLGVYYEKSGDYILALKYYSIPADEFGKPWTDYIKWINFRNAKTNAPSDSAVENGNINKRILATVSGDDQYCRLINQGIQVATQGDFQKAFSFWQQALELDPARPEARANLGVVRERFGKLDEALRDYEYAAKYLGRPWDQYYSKLKKKLTQSR